MSKNLEDFWFLVQRDMSPEELTANYVVGVPDRGIRVVPDFMFLLEDDLMRLFANQGALAKMLGEIIR